MKAATRGPSSDAESQMLLDHSLERHVIAKGYKDCDVTRNWNFCLMARLTLRPSRRFNLNLQSGTPLKQDLEADTKALA